MSESPPVKPRALALPDRYGKWALVAGASEGLGAAFASQLAARGMNLVVVSRRGHLLTQLQEQLTTEYQVEVRCLVGDLADPTTAEALADAVAELELGIIIYNAAYTPVGPSPKPPRRK